MRYLKLILSSILVLMIAGIVIWVGVFAIIFSLIATPIIAWWFKRKKSELEAEIENIKTAPTQDATSKASYKVIEAEYEIIEK